MKKTHPLIGYLELTEDELDMIAWRASRGCHFDGGFLFASEYGKEVIQNDVPVLIAEIRRLRSSLTPRVPDAFGVCPHGVNLGNQACSACEPEKFGAGNA